MLKTQIVYAWFLFIELALSQLTYEDAQCNGGQIQGLRNHFLNSNFEGVEINLSNINTPVITEHDITLPTGDTDGSVRITASAIEPCTGRVYVILGGVGPVQVWLGYLDNPLDPTSVTFVAEIEDDGGSNWGERIQSITFDTAGNLYGISEPGPVVQISINTMTGVLTEQNTPLSGNCDDPDGAFLGCVQSIGYNWDDSFFCRIASGGPDNFDDNFMWCKPNGQDVWNEYTLVNRYLCNGTIFEFSYIGNDVWLVACNGDVRTLDTSDGINAVFQPIGADGVIDVSAGSGLIATSDAAGTVLCEPQCPTSSPTSDPTMTTLPPTPSTNTPTNVPSISPTPRPTEAPTDKPTESPTAAPTDSSDSSDSNGGSSDEIFMAMNGDNDNEEIVDEVEDNSDTLMVVNIDPSVLWGFGAILLWLSVMVWICIKRRSSSPRNATIEDDSV